MAVRQLFTNNAVSLLASGINATQTTLTVLAGHGALYPNPGPNQFFTVTLENQAATIREIVHVTARSGDVFTVVRGQEGTDARAWTATSGNDTLVDHRVTAETLNRLANHYSNPDFTALTDYKEALDYLLALDWSASPDLTAINNAITALQGDVAILQGGNTTLTSALTTLQTQVNALQTQLNQLDAELTPIVDSVQTLQTLYASIGDEIEQLQQQLILNNAYSNPAFPAITTLSEGLDYLLQGNPVAGQNEVDPPVTTTLQGGITIVTLPSAYVPGTTAVYVGGLRQKRGVDFIEASTTTLHLQYPLSDAQIADGQNVVVDYVVA